MLAEAIIKRVTDLAESAHETVADGLDNLAALAGNAADSERLAKALHVIAEAEGAYEWLTGYLSVAQGRPEYQPEYWYMLQSQRTQGANDTWSGRENDTRRAKNDGRIQAAQQVFNLITR